MIVDIKYNGVDITQHVNLTKAIGYDMSGGSCDHIVLEFEDPELWMSWKPKTDDVIEIMNGKYSSGNMFINSVSPEDGAFGIVATAIPSSARRKFNMGYMHMTLDNIMESCAAESRMDKTIFGIDPMLKYNFLLREDEGCAAFLESIARMEGAVLKCWNNRYTMIGIEKAQTLAPLQTIDTEGDIRGMEYFHREDLRIRNLSVVSPYGNYTATDTAARGDGSITLTGLPVTNNVQAARWARNLLMINNRQAEKIQIDSTFNAGWTAMIRIDIVGNGDMHGQWIIDHVQHDFVGESSTAVLVRCIDTVV